MFGKKKRTQDGIVTIDVKELDEEGKKRTLSGRSLLLVNCIAFAMSIFQMYASGISAIDVTIFRAMHLGFALVLIFLLFPMTKKSSKKSISWYDYCLAILAAIPNIYLACNVAELARRAGRPTQMDLIMGAIIILLTLEAARRVLGTALVCVAIFFICYTLFGPYFPGMFAHRGASFSGLIRHMILSTEGVFGVALGASAKFVFLFCTLGAFMNAIKADDILIKLAISAFGKQKGGPAKAAVISSALFGTISGSALANISTTGAFTIPLMKKTGYEAEFAGAVETAASIGGQIMPPVMGSVAFIIAEFLGVSYLEVCLAASVPALLYFGAIFISVHQKASAMGLKGVPDDQIPDGKAILKKQGYLLLPLIMIIVLLVIGFSASMAGFIAIISVIVISWFNAESRFTPQKLFYAFADGAKSAIGVAIACAVVGFIIGSFTLSGLGVKMASVVLALGQGNIFLTLVLSAITSIVLGMGVPTTANYIMMSMITVPVVIQLGVNPLAAHLFCYYFGIVSDLTPPVALGALTAAGLAKGKFIPTAINSMKLGVAAFVIPFIFCFNPVLLLGQTEFSFMIIIHVLFAIIGMTALSCALHNYLLCAMKLPERFLVAICALAMVYPEIWTSAVGIAIMVVLVANQKRRVARAGN